MNCEWGITCMMDSLVARLTLQNWPARGQNTSVTSFSADNVFSEGTTYQMATLTGDVTSGYTATLTVGIAA